MRRLICLWICCLYFPLPTRAAAVWTEEQFLASLTSEAPAARVEGLDLERARAAQIAAGQLAEPRVGFEREETGEEVERTWAVAWTPPLDGRRKLAKDAAAVGVEASQQHYSQRLMELRAAMRAAYARWALARARHSLLAEHAAAIEELATWLSRRAAAGEAAGLDARILQQSAVSARLAQELARAQAHCGMAAVSAWGEPPPEAVPRLPELPEVAEPSLGRRGDLAALKLEIERLRLQARLSRKQLTAPRLEVGWKRVEEGGGSQDGPVVGVQWRLPVGKDRQAKRALASAELGTAEARLELALARGEAELAGAHAAYRDLRRTLLTNGAEDLESLAGAARKSFQLGEGSLVDLLNVLGALRDTRLEHLKLYAAALAAHRDLELAAGRSLIPGEQP